MAWPSATHFKLHSETCGWHHSGSVVYFILSNVLGSLKLKPKKQQKRQTISKGWIFSFVLTALCLFSFPPLCVTCGNKSIIKVFFRECFCEVGQDYRRGWVKKACDICKHPLYWGIQCVYANRSCPSPNSWSSPETLFDCDVLEDKSCGHTFHSGLFSRFCLRWYNGQMTCLILHKARLSAFPLFE